MHQAHHGLVVTTQVRKKTPVAHAGSCLASVSSQAFISVALMVVCAGTLLVIFNLLRLESAKSKTNGKLQTPSLRAKKRDDAFLLEKGDLLVLGGKPVDDGVKRQYYPANRTKHALELEDDLEAKRMLMESLRQKMNERQSSAPSTIPERDIGNHKDSRTTTAHRKHDLNKLRTTESKLRLEGTPPTPVTLNEDLQTTPAEELTISATSSSKSPAKDPLDPEGPARGDLRTGSENTGLPLFYGDQTLESFARGQRAKFDLIANTSSNHDEMLPAGVPTSHLEESTKESNDQPTPAPASTAIKSEYKRANSSETGEYDTKHSGNLDPSGSAGHNSSARHQASILTADGRIDHAKLRNNSGETVSHRTNATDDHLHNTSKPHGDNASDIPDGSVGTASGKPALSTDLHASNDYVNRTTQQTSNPDNFLDQIAIDTTQNQNHSIPDINNGSNKVELVPFNPGPVL